MRISSQGVVLPAQLGDESFSAAHGSDVTTVLNRQDVRWPALARPQQPPAPFVVNMRFSQPFVLLPGRQLAIEIVSEPSGTKAESHTWYADFASFDRSAAEGKTRLLGRGCPFGFQTRGDAPPIDGETPLRIYSYTRLTGKPQQFAILWTGAQTKQFGAVPLPLDLGPIGAPGCQLYLEPLLTDAGSIDANDSRGTARFVMPALPKHPGLAGLRLFQQALVFDTAANVLGLRTSNYLEVTLGKLAAPLPVRSLYHSSSASNDAPTKALDGGLVLELRTQ